MLEAMGATHTLAKKPLRAPMEIYRSVPSTRWLGGCSLTQGPPLLEQPIEEVQWIKVTEGVATKPRDVPISGQAQQDIPNKRAKSQRGRRID